MNIFCIIVTYNGMQWGERCFSALRASTIPITTVVVDNGSTDGTPQYIQSRFPEVVLLPQTKNLGFGQGNNAGIRYALTHGATHVLLLNQDAWIDADMVERLLPYDDGNTLLSPIHLTGEGDRYDANFERNAIRRSREYDRFAIEQQRGITSKYYTDEINAACWLLPRNILEEVGGFNPLFFQYAEDNDYLQRLHFHGKETCFVSGTFCYHDRAHIPPKNPTKQLIYQQLVLRTLDINRSALICTLRRWRYIIAVWHTALAENRWADITFLYQARKAFYAHYKEILRNRQILKTKGPLWIDCNL